MTPRSGPSGSRGWAWWPTGDDLEAMVGLARVAAPDRGRAERTLRADDAGGARSESPTALAARLSLLFR